MLATVGSLAVLAFLLAAMARQIRDDRDPRRSIWREFGLGLILMILFFATWVGHGVTEWQVFTDEQRSHGEEPELGDFMAEFGSSTLENWQSEFLQLFSFVTLAAMYIHKGSSESKDSEEKLESSLRRIEEHLGTLPPTAPTEQGEEWMLPHTPLESQDAAERDEARRSALTEPRRT
ncbi:MAG TPA: DUF6766 family protein [Acidimicrobiales bacterium]|nr:DUF6766 family protein [Acidimicrobiales bacterium]